MEGHSLSGWNCSSCSAYGLRPIFTDDHVWKAKVGSTMKEITFKKCSDYGLRNSREDMVEDVSSYIYVIKF